MVKMKRVKLMFKRGRYTIVGAWDKLFQYKRSKVVLVWDSKAQLIHSLRNPNNKVYQIYHRKV